MSKIYLITFVCIISSFNIHATEADSTGVERFGYYEFEDSIFTKWLRNNVITTAIADSLSPEEWDIYVSANLRFHLCQANLTIALERTGHVLWDPYKYAYVTQVEGYTVFFDWSSFPRFKASSSWRTPYKFYKWDNRFNRSKDPDFKEYDAYLWKITITTTDNGYTLSPPTNYSYIGEAYKNQPVRGTSKERQYAETVRIEAIIDDRSLKNTMNQ